MMKDFPIHSSSHDWRKSVPFGFVEQFREQVEQNHGQTLERLAERGGLDCGELCVAAMGEDLSKFHTHTRVDAQAYLDKKLKEFEFSLGGRS